MTQRTVQISREITISGAWSSLLEFSSGSEYTVPATGRGDLKWIKATNLSGGSVLVDLAIYSSGSPPNTHLISGPVTLESGDMYMDDSGFTIPSLFGVYGRSRSDGTIQLVLTANVLEIIPEV
jgi:hypothetical protein